MTVSPAKNKKDQTTYSPNNHVLIRMQASNAPSAMIHSSCQNQDDFGCSSATKNSRPSLVSRRRKVAKFWAIKLLILTRRLLTSPFGPNHCLWWTLLLLRYNMNPHCIWILVGL